MASPFDDPSSQSNYPAVKVTHVDFDVDVDFDTKTIAGTVALRAVVGDAPSEELVLDTRDLTIESCRVDGMDASFDLQAKPHAVMGAALTVKLGETRAPGTTIDVVVSYRTSPSSSAVQWLRPEQTAGGKHPYLFTQCQAIHARALYPCQDTPAAKLTYGAKVTVPAPLRALMSAIPVGEGVPSGAAGKTTFAFEQTVPQSPYLLALAVGNVEARDIGPRSKVWSEPEMVDAGAHEFAETEDFLVAAESVAGPYVWGRYDLLLLPRVSRTAGWRIRASPSSLRPFWPGTGRRRTSWRTRSRTAGVGTS